MDRCLKVWVSCEVKNDKGAFCRSARGWNGKCKTGSFYEAFWNKWCEGGSKPRPDCRSCTKTRYELGDSNKGHRCGRTGYSDVGQHAQLCSNCRTARNRL